MGIYDGVLTGIAVAGPLNLHEAGPYMLKVDFGAIGMIGGIIIGKNRWDSFPPDVRGAFNEAAKEYRAKVVAESTAVIDASMKKMISGGLKVQELSPADRKAVADSLPNIAKSWADAVKAQGIPGDRIINDYMTAIKAREPNMARDWTIKIIERNPGAAHLAQRPAIPSSSLVDRRVRAAGRRRAAPRA